MSSRRSLGVLLLLSGVGLGALQAAAVSEQQADAFTKKMAIVTQRGVSGARGDARGLAANALHGIRSQLVVRVPKPRGAANRRQRTRA